MQSNCSEPIFNAEAQRRRGTEITLSTDLRRLTQISVWICRSAEAAQISIFAAGAKLVLPPLQKQEIGGPLGPLHNHTINAGKAKVTVKVSLRPCASAPLR